MADVSKERNSSFAWCSVFDAITAPGSTLHETIGVPVADLRRLTAVLDVISEGRGTMTLNDMANRTKLPRSSVHRILRILEGEQYVTRAVGHTGYALGPRLLSYGLSAQLNVLAVNRGRLAQLARSVEHDTQLAVVYGNEALILDQVSARGNAVGAAMIGGRLPLHATGIGKALLSRLSPEKLTAYLQRPLSRFTPQTVTDPARLAHQLDAIRRLHVGVDIEEHRSGICTIATVMEVPVCGFQAISIAIPAPRFKRKSSHAIEALYEINTEINVGTAKLYYQ
jgi:IclR family acetate operon transcriptional repressor